MIDLGRNANIGLVRITSELEEIRYLNFDGAAHQQQVMDLLVSDEEAAMPQQDNLHAIGLMEPGKSIYTFFAEQYSPSVLNLLKRFDNENPDQVLQDMNNTLKEAFRNIPPDWQKPYLLSETAGLGFRLYNETEINKLKGLISMARMIINNYD